ncbi:MAG: hypothetical protein WCC00_07395 [Candidatus Aminicenantales bacterium]
MADQFREAEATFSLLREKFKDKRISPQEFADSLKQLRIKDEEGRFWVIGAQSGKWYAFENGEWVEAKPPSQMEKKAICIACGFENDLEAESCARCGSRGDESAPEALAARDGAGPAAALEATPARAGSVTTLRSVDIASFLWFFGVLGLFAGILFGLLAGATGLFSGFVARLPAFFADHRGDLLGGLAFSVAGGILGFAIGAGTGAAAAVVSNGILSLIGGVRLRRS